MATDDQPDEVDQPDQDAAAPAAASGSRPGAGDAPPSDAPPSDAPPSDAEVRAELERLRLENERLRREVEVDHGATERRHARRRRGIAAVAMLVIGSILLPASVLTVWTRNQLLDTDRYVETVGPLASDPTVQSALSGRISDKVAELVDVKSLAEDALPDNARFLAVPIAAGADNLIDQATTRVIRSDQFEQAWIEANRVGHDGLVAALTGREGEVISTKDGKVVIELGAVVKRVLDRVDDQFGLDIASKVPADDLNVDFVIVDSKQLADVQSTVRMLDRLAWLSIILAVVFLVGSVLVAPDHRKGVLRVGIGIAVGMLVLYLGFTLGRELFLTNLPDGVERPDVAAVVFDTLTRFVLQAVRTLFMIGVVLFVGAWLVGPSTAAAKLRHGWDRVLGRGGAAAGSAVDLGPVPGWVARHLNGVRAGIVAVAVLVLVWWDRPTGKVVLFIGLATLVPLALAQLVAGAAHRGPAPDEDGPDGGDAAGSTAPTASV